MVNARVALSSPTMRWRKKRIRSLHSQQSLATSNPELQLPSEARRGLQKARVTIKVSTKTSPIAPELRKTGVSKTPVLADEG
jgi:hypothetical protein